MKDPKGGDTEIAYAFGPFRLVPGECLLLREGKPVALTPQAFDLLRLLVESAGHLKTREELIETLWPTTTVEENSLPWNVSAVRKALGDDSDAPRYIETVRRRGYRFIAPVEVEEAGKPGKNGKGAAAGRRRWPWVIAGGLAAAVAAVALVLVLPRLSGGSRTAATAPRRAGIAVLPFENLNVDKKDAYFVAGVQDLILTKLADIGELKVIARTSTAKYGSHPDDLKAIARQLGVSTILEGSVQKAGNEVLINVQLVDARSDAHIWAQSYRRTLDNVFGVEGEVAEKVAKALEAKLSPAETRRLSTAMSANPAANNLFLRAEYFTRQGNLNYDKASWKAAIPLYRQALEKVPDFALALARLSFTESILAWFGGGGEPVDRLNADARAEVERALALAPDLPEARLALGYSDYYGRGDYAAAEKAFAAVLKLRPSDANAWAARGYVLRRQGRFDAAIDSFRQAVAHDPRNSKLVFELGATTMMAGRYPEAEQAFLRALALNPDNVEAQEYHALSILYGSGNVGRALAAMRGRSPFLQLQRVNLLTLRRKYRAALTVLDGIPDQPDIFSFDVGSKALLRADLYRLLGDNARSERLFRQALPEERARLTAQVGIDRSLAFVWSNIARAELGLGHIPAGLTAIGKSQALIERSRDHVIGPTQMEINAALYAQAGRADLAVPLLAKTLAAPGIGAYYSPAMLWIDPAWDPIRRDPRFRALLEKYAKYKPAGAATDTPGDGSRANPESSLVSQRR